MKEPDWKFVAEKLLWYNFISHPHEKTGWCIMDKEDEYTIARGYHKGDIVHGLTFCSFIHPIYYHELTWKDLMWEWDVMKEHIMSDTHDCSKCFEHDTCRAFFKDDKDHEQCSWWQNNVNKELHFESDYEKELETIKKGLNDPLIVKALKKLLDNGTSDEMP